VQLGGQLADARCDVRFAAQLERRGNVVGHRQRRVVDELLVHHGDVALAHRQAGDILAVDADLPGAGPVEARHDAHQRGFAGLRRAQQHRDGAAVRRQAHVIEPGLRTHGLADAVQGQLHLAAFRRWPELSAIQADTRPHSAAL
jgi:hypothetical protein